MATLSLSTPNPSATRNAQASTDALARLLATENIRVEHQPVPTAMFDTASRTLVLPVWKGMSQDLYDMLVGHEVGHALWTPACDTTVTNAITRIRAAGAPSDAWAKSILNIVEDARIERLIKEKFPGLRRNFTIAYRELVARDIFGLASVNGDPNAKGFVDRFNLYHKCGALGLMQVAFDSQEQPLVARGERIASFEDAVVLCEDICVFLRENSNNNEPQDNDNGDENGDLGQGQGADEPNGRGAESQGNADDAANRPEAGNSPQGEQGGDSEADGKPEDNSEDKPNQTGNTSGMDTGKGRTAENGAGIGESISTDDKMTNGLGKMTDTNNGGYYHQYGEAPVFDMDRLVVRAEDVVALWRDQFAKEPSALPLIDSLYEAWKRDNLPTVMNMVKRFEQRKAADDARRTMTAKSGRIDPSRLAYYKVSEDLFLSMTTTTDGKSHGLVMLVDWSGSMGGVLGSVVSQVLCLVEFCRKTGVPYEVYAFTDCITGWKPKTNEQDANADSDRDSYGVNGAVCRVEVGRLNPTGFRMIQFLRSGMARADHADAVRGMVSVMTLQGYAPFNTIIRAKYDALYSGSRQYWGHHEGLLALAPKFAAPEALSLHATPLNEGLLASADLIEAFRKRTGAQIVNLAVLTDGDATRSVEVHESPEESTSARVRYKDRNGWDRCRAVVLRWGSKQYPFKESGCYGHRSETNAIIRYLRDRTGARVYGFYLMPDAQATRSLKRGHHFKFPTPQAQQAAEKQLDLEGSCILPHPAYDEYYLVGVAFATEAEDFMDRLNPTALSARKIASSFAKGMSKRSSTRTIMVRFTDCFASGKPSQHKMR